MENKCTCRLIYHGTRRDSCQAFLHEKRFLVGKTGGLSHENDLEYFQSTEASTVRG